MALARAPLVAVGRIGVGLLQLAHRLQGQPGAGAAPHHEHQQPELAGTAHFHRALPDHRPQQQRHG